MDLRMMGSKRTRGPNVIFPKVQVVAGHQIWYATLKIRCRMCGELGNQAMSGWIADIELRERGRDLSY